jgi:hypothetical protein
MSFTIAKVDHFQNWLFWFKNQNPKQPIVKKPTKYGDKVLIKSTEQVKN